MWLHVPTSAFAAEAADSTLDSDSLCLTLAASATWKEKSLKPASWRRALSRAGWTTRLSGLTYSPSTLSRGVDVWLASLAVSLVSPTVTPESVLEKTTSGTFGLGSLSWYQRLRLAGSSLRTFQASLLTTTPTYDSTYRPWITRLMRACSQREKLAQGISDAASSSWPTATADDGEQSGGPERHSLTLHRMAQQWPTPSTAPEAPNTNSNTVNGPTSLGEAAGLWQMPSAGGHTTHNSGDMAHSYDLLPNQAKAWATPNARDHKGQDLPSRQGVPSLPAQVMQMDGRPTSPNGRVLNPRFVEALMGWPLGATDYESSETELSLWWQRMRSLLCLLASRNLGRKEVAKDDI